MQCLGVTETVFCSAGFRFRHKLDKLQRRASQPAGGGVKIVCGFSFFWGGGLKLYV